MKLIIYMNIPELIVGLIFAILAMIMAGLTYLQYRQGVFYAYKGRQPWRPTLTYSKKDYPKDFDSMLKGEIIFWAIVFAISLFFVIKSFFDI